MRGVFILVLNHKDNKLLSNCRDFNGLDDFFLKLPYKGDWIVLKFLNHANLSNKEKYDVT